MYSHDITADQKKLHIGFCCIEGDVYFQKLHILLGCKRASGTIPSLHNFNIVVLSISAPEEGSDHGHVNNGYADAGPRPTAMEDMSQHQGASGPAAFVCLSVYFLAINKCIKKIFLSKARKPRKANKAYVKD